eukprot:5107701-Amphidinium_carterae.1
MRSSMRKFCRTRRPAESDIVGSETWVRTKHNHTVEMIPWMLGALLAGKDKNAVKTEKEKAKEMTKGKAKQEQMTLAGIAGREAITPSIAG